MARALDVYLHRQLAGQLIQNDDGQMTFAYASSWLQNPEARPLSQSLPLREAPFTRKECRGFFAGILPEETQRLAIAQNLGISARNDFAMLELIGGECAGAVTFLPAGEELAQDARGNRPLSERELAETLRRLPRRPLMAGEDGVRLSLAGAQNKLAVHIAGGVMSIPLGSAPSTHILKPAPQHYEGLVFNEAFCMKLASAIGLNTAAVEVGRVEGLDYLLVERYDRRTLPAQHGLGKTLRMHQEDFCQALGIVSENKYQREGGPSLQQSFALLRDASSVPVVDLQALLNGVIFNYLIGNNDAHGKNFSLLYGSAEGQTRLAPLYDLISTAFYPDLARTMAMKIGGEYNWEKIQPYHFERLAEEAGLSKAIVKRRVSEVARNLLERLPALSQMNAVASAVSELVKSNCEHVIARFKE